MIWKRRPPESLLAWLGFLGIALIVAAGIWTQGEKLLVGADNDVYINPWADWWSSRAWSDPAESLWRTDRLLYPLGADLTFHSFSPLNTSASLALRPLLGPIAAYNLVILLNIACNGLAMYQLARYLTGSRAAAFMAGVVFAFNSHSLYQTAHPVLHSIWCFPWVTLFFLRASRENSVRLALVAAAFVALGALTSTVLLYLLIVYTGFLWLFLLLSRREERVPWRVLVAFGLASGLMCLPIVWHPLRAALLAGNDSFATDPFDSIAGDILGPLTPPWLHPLKRGIYFGVVPLALVLFAWRASRKGAGVGERAARRAERGGRSGQREAGAALWVWLLGLAYLFSIGPRPDLLGHDVAVTLPWSALLVPFLRNTYRLNILIGLALAVLVAFGWRALAARLPAAVRRPAWLALLALLLADYLAVPFPRSPATVSPFYTEVLATVPDDVALATVPFGRQADKRYLFDQAFHGHPITGGVISRAGDDAFAFIRSSSLLRAADLTRPPIRLPAEPLPELRRLAGLGVGFLVVHRQILPGDDYEEAYDSEAWVRAIPLTPVYADDWLVAYDLRPLAGAPSGGASPAP